MKSLLIITEQFDIGGLETHVAGEVACLANLGFQIHLSTGTNAPKTMLPKETTSLTTGLTMGSNINTAELIQTVESLRKIIRDKNIECVHAHPFTSLIPSLIAAELERVPFVVTLHGPASFPNCFGSIYDFLLISVILPKADMVVAVSQEMADLAAPYVENSKLHVIHNGIFIERFHAKHVQITSDNRWVVVSRLDEYKIVGIRDFVLKSAAAGIPGVLIAGDGAARNMLEMQLESDGLSSFVEFIGATSEVPGLMQQFAGVAGMGRVALEGLASGKRVILIGYNGVKGLLIPGNFTIAAKANFSGRNLSNIDDAEFVRQILTTRNEVNELIDKVRIEYDDKYVWRMFDEKIQALKSHEKSLLTDVYLKFLSDIDLPVGPYLYSNSWLDQLGRLVHSAKYFNHVVGSNYNYTWNRYTSEQNKRQIIDLYHAISVRDAQIVERDAQIVERDAQIVERDAQIVERDAQIVECDAQIANLRESLTEILNSKSWRITKPVRLLLGIVRYLSKW